MTEKRFENRLNKDDIKFNTQNPVWDNEICDALNVFDMIDLLNEQHETIQQLQSANMEMEDYSARLEEENEQLKQQKIELLRLIDNNIEIYENINTNVEFHQGEIQGKLTLLYNLREVILNDRETI